MIEASYEHLRDQLSLVSEMYEILLRPRAAVEHTLGVV
jgi:hypothetical protein